MVLMKASGVNVMGLRVFRMERRALCVQVRVIIFLMTVMMMQLVASGRGVCCLPNWAMAEYLHKGYVTARRLGPEGLFGTLYAAVRDDMMEMPYLQDFLLTAKDTSFATLEGVSARGSD